MPLLDGTRPVLRTGVFFGNLQAVLLGQILHGLHKSHAGVFHQEVDRVAVLAAAEAVVKLLGRADRERGRFFAMKRAQAHEVGAPFFELHIAAHDFHHVSARQQFLDESLGDGHAPIVET